MCVAARKTRSRSCFSLHIGPLLWTATTKDANHGVRQIGYFTAELCGVSQGHRAHFLVRFHQYSGPFFLLPLLTNSMSSRFRITGQQRGALVRSLEVNALVLRRFATLILLTQSSSCLGVTASLASLTSALSVVFVGRWTKS